MFYFTGTVHLVKYNSLFLIILFDWNNNQLMNNKKLFILLYSYKITYFLFLLKEYPRDAGNIFGIFPVPGNIPQEIFPVAHHYSGYIKRSRK